MKGNVTGGFGSAKKDADYSGPNSTRPTQTQESDLSNEGGTAPGGVVAFMGAGSQWANSNAANRNNSPAAAGVVTPEQAAGHMAKFAAGQAVDEAPAEKGDVPVHPGLAPGQFRTARDANYDAPDGETNLSASETGGHPLSPSGKFRGQTPEIEKQTRGSYRP